MKDAVARMQQAGQALAGIGETTDAAAFQSQLRDFVGKGQRLGRALGRHGAVGRGAATARRRPRCRHELKQSIETRSTAPLQGVGLRDLGVSIDRTHLARFDTRQSSCGAAPTDRGRSAP